MNDKLLSQIRHFLSAGGYLLLIPLLGLLFLPESAWDTFIANAKKLSPIVKGLVAALGAFGIYLGQGSLLRKNPSPQDSQPEVGANPDVPDTKPEPPAPTP